MFKWLYVLTIGIILFGASTTYKSYKNYKVYLVRVRDKSEMKVLQSLVSNVSEIDFLDIMVRDTKKCRIMVKSDMVKYFLKTLKKNNIKRRLIVDDFSTLIDGERKQNSRSPRYTSPKLRIATPRLSNEYFEHFWTYDEVMEYLDYLTIYFGEHVEVATLGMSEEGRRIKTIRIFGENLSSNPHTILIDATIHAREWASTMMAIYTIYELVEKRESNLNLLNDINWVILPIANPDGYVYSHTEDRLWRKTRTKFANTDCIGIDINHNFDFHWNTEGAASDHPCNDNYRGPTPNSIPEVVSLTKFLKRYSNTKLYLTLHSYGGFILYPYGYAIRMIKKYKVHERLARRLREEIEKNSNELDRSMAYKVGNAGFLLDPSSGGSDDYAAGVANIPLVYSIVLPGGKIYGFDCSPDEILSVVSSTFQGIKVFGNYLGTQREKYNPIEENNHTDDKPFFEFEKPQHTEDKPFFEFEKPQHTENKPVFQFEKPHHEKKPILIIKQRSHISRS